MKIKRLIPCPCPPKTCKSIYEFDFDLLEERRRSASKKKTAECHCGYEDIPLVQLLYAERPDPIEDKIDAVRKLLEGVGGNVETVRSQLAAFQEEVAFRHREFLKEFEALQTRPEDECPNVFSLRPVGGSGFEIEGVYGNTMELQLYCQQPGCWHPTETGGRYLIEKPSRWLQSLAPYLQRLFAGFKYLPIVNLGFASEATNLEEFIRKDVRWAGEIMDYLSRSGKNFGHSAEGGGMPDEGDAASVLAEGSEWRVLRRFLDHLDPSREWGGLRKIRTPEGHYLWLCKYHADKVKK
jgi:hypothetical protein